MIAPRSEGIKCWLHGSPENKAVAHQDHDNSKLHASIFTKLGL